MHRTYYPDARPKRDYNDTSGTVDDNIDKADTTTTITSDAPDSSVVNETYTVTWIVAIVSPGGGSLTGTVNVTGDGSCSAAVSVGQCDLTSAGAGGKTLTARYGGGINFNGSSDTETHAVIARETSTSIVCTPTLSPINVVTSCTATVTDVETAGSPVVPSGNVTFTGEGGTFGPSPGICPLIADSIASTYTATCFVTYTNSAAAVDSMTASYAGTGQHLGGATTEPVLLVFYDPNAGFVTGGGWIMSPLGAYQADPSLTGKATFGFVSKYQKGAKVPTGNTEFQFHVAKLNFSSTSYDWLVVSGAKAQYRGIGTVSGLNGYSFLLTATDGQVNGGGGVDKFRIKIWNAGGVVYDNDIGGPDDIDAANPQAISSGTIVIDSK